MVTIRDIAKKAGVTHTTVSAVLNERYTPTQPKAVHRAQRIRNLAQQLGYRPNSAARAMAKGRFQRVGLVLPHGRSSYIPHEFMGGLTHALAESQHQLAACELPPADSGDDLPHMLRDLSVDGTINLVDTPPRDVQKMLADVRLPMVWVNVKLPSNCVYPDEIDGARRLTAHLLSQGHRRIAFVDFHRNWTWQQEPAPDLDPGGPLEARRTLCQTGTAAQGGHYSKEDRRVGYELAMQQAGLTSRTLARSVDSIDQQIMQTRQLLRGSDRPDAVIMPNEQAASRFFRAAMAEGVVVPEALPLGTFTWGSEASAVLGLTTMVYGGPRLAEVAVETLKQQIEHASAEAPARTIPGRLVIN